MVKSGGRLVYATCSLLTAENEEIVAAFDAEHERDFVRLDAAELLREQGVERADELVQDRCLRLWPHRHRTDGFFAAVFCLAYILDRSDSWSGRVATGVKILLFASIGVLMAAPYTLPILEIIQNSYNKNVGALVQQTLQVDYLFNYVMPNLFGSPLNFYVNRQHEIPSILWFSNGLARHDFASTILDMPPEPSRSPQVFIVFQFQTTATNRITNVQVRFGIGLSSLLPFFSRQGSSRTDQM